ncbi:MAG TPA: hypothetical protein VNI20_02925 [Fimbriimonadaceae bacterium]|nr:hypothetical protein [Fimbriimonadaceae bacterium]
MKFRIMYIERKAESLNGEARIGRVEFSKTGKTLHYRGISFQSLKGGYKANYYDIETGDQYWISGCKKNGQDRLYRSNIPIEIDEDVREEYWAQIRELPRFKGRTTVEPFH